MGSVPHHQPALARRSVSIFNIGIMVINDRGGKLSPRVGKELTAQNVAAPEVIGAKIVSSSASASTVIFTNTLVHVLIVLQQCASSGATCHPVSGNCSCTPGYTGPLCELPCPNKTFGEGCKQKCSCPDGHNCDHVTGGCIRCQPNTWGPACRENCTCSSEGTALCSREDGRCFCEANYRGSNCEEHCPFGFYGDGCLPAPVNASCSCPSSLFLCDPVLGCICPLGQHCGIETENQVILCQDVDGNVLGCSKLIMVARLRWACFNPPIQTTHSTSPCLSLFSLSSS